MALKPLVLNIVFNARGPVPDRDKARKLVEILNDAAVTLESRYDDPDDELFEDGDVFEQFTLLNDVVQQLESQLEEGS